MTEPEPDPELDALRADLHATYGPLPPEQAARWGEHKWRCLRAAAGKDGPLLCAWLMPATTPQVLLCGRTPAAVEARVMRFYAVLAHPDPDSDRSPARQAREAAEGMDVSEYES